MILYRDVAAFLILYQEALTGVLGRSFFLQGIGDSVSHPLRQYFRIHNIIYL